MCVFNVPHLALLEPFSGHGSKDTSQEHAARIIRIHAGEEGARPRLVVALYEPQQIELGEILRITLRSPGCPSLGFRVKVIARYAERMVLEIHSSANIQTIDRALFKSWSSGQSVDLSPFQRIEENEEKTQTFHLPTLRSIPRQYIEDEPAIREAC